MGKLAYKLEFQDSGNDIYYYPETNLLTDSDGRRIIDPLDFDDREAANVRIILGKGCNFRCKYCLPTGVGRQASKEEEMSPEALADEIIRVTEGRGIGGVLFFGGEPLLYFEKMKKLYEKLKDFCVPSFNGNFFIATNGSLLNKTEITDWLIENKIQAGISWDGPASKITRGIDIMEIPGVKENIRRMFKEAWTQNSLMPVFSRANPSLRKYIDYAKKILELDKIPVHECSPITVVDPHSLEMAIPFEELGKYCLENMHTLITAEDAECRSNNLSRFLIALDNPVELKRQFCHYMFDTDLNLDMTGDLLYCKNAVKTDSDPNTGLPYRFGHISDLKVGDKYPWAGDIILDHRNKYKIRTCETCLVKMMCKGGCLLAPEEYRAYNCEAAFHEGLAQLAKILHTLTGKTLFRVSAVTPDHSLA